MPNHKRNMFELLRDDDDDIEEEEVEREMTIWGPAIGRLNWAEEMENEDKKKDKKKEKRR